MAKKPKRKTKKIRNFLKYHSWITGFFMFAYVSLGVSWGWDLLGSDILQKGRVAGAAISMTQKIFGAPDKPVLSANQGCDALRTPFVRLAWTSDDDATSFDVYRDNLELMTGVTDLSYVDSNVVGLVDYEYYILAKGPAGDSASDPLSISAPGCPLVANPSVSVVTFDGKSLGNGIAITENRMPVFSGTTNIPNASIDLEIQGNLVTYATTIANVNGFWQWTPPAELADGQYVLYMSAVEQIESDLSASSSFIFKIGVEQAAEEEKDSDDDENYENKNSDKKIPQPVQDQVNPNRPIVSQGPVEFELELSSNEYVRGVDLDAEAYRGENIDVTTTFTDVLDEGVSAEMTYSIISSENEVVSEYSEIVYPKKGEAIQKKIYLPYSLELGKYKMRITVKIGNVTVSNENYFMLKDRPLIIMGGGIFITKYDIISNIGWWLLACLLLLFILFFTGEREYYMYRKAMFHVTENILKKKGFIH